MPCNIKHCQLKYSYAIIFGQRTFLFIVKLGFHKKRELYYYIIVLFSKIVYYLNRLGQALRLTSL